MVIRVFSVAGSFYKREDGAGLTRFLKNLLALDFLNTLPETNLFCRAFTYHLSDTDPVDVL